MRSVFAPISVLVQLSLFFLLAFNAEAVEVAIMPTFDAQLLPGEDFPLGDGSATLTIDGGTAPFTNYPVKDVLAEFPLDQIPLGAIISSAQLMLDVTPTFNEATIMVLGYEGDGLASLSDEDINTTLIGTSAPVDSSSNIAIDLNSTFIASLLGSASHVGLRLASAAVNTAVDVIASESPTGDVPKLLVEYSIPSILGDMNGDGFVDVDDAGLFILALTDRAAYNLAFPMIDADIVGNVNQDGQFDLGDLASFNDLFASGSASASASAVPEPGVLVMMAWGWLGLCLRSGSRRGRDQAKDQLLWRRR